MCTQLEEMIHELPLHIDVLSVGCVLNDTIKRTLFAFIDVDGMSIFSHTLSIPFFVVCHIRGHARSTVDSNNQICKLHDTV